jgi:hypothetical protein
MQKIVGSNPIIRSHESPAQEGFLVASAVTGMGSSASIVPIRAIQDGVLAGAELRPPRLE